MRNVKPGGAVSLLIACLALAAACSPAPAAGNQTAGGANPTCFKRSSEAIGGPFQLTSADGKAVTEADFKGRKALVFFGYTYCPDVCPVTLFNLGKAMDSVAADKRPTTLFVSVDPERDTPEKLTQYIASNGFPKDIMGLTGTPEQLTGITQAFKTQYGRDEATGASGYLVSHSSILYLMDKDWKLQTFFMEGESPAEIAGCLSALE
jgi:protein SCO1/2